MEFITRYFLTNRRLFSKIKDVEFQIATLVDLWREVADKHPGVILDTDAWKITKREPNQ